MRFILILMTALALTACASLTVEHQPYQARPDARKLAVFMDGTGNDESSQSNLSKLHSLVRLTADTRVHAVYVRGVGLNGRVLGLTMGIGIGEDVRQAYRFLARNYRSGENDEIYLFGFSRGGYAARILAGMIYVAGLPDLSAITGEDAQNELIEQIYEAYEGEKSLDERRQLVGALKLPPMHHGVRITFMGLWDTIEALDVPDYEERIDHPNPDYVDQLCNIDRAVHAVSIDDNRAKLFTPILLTRQGLVANCPELQSAHAQQEHIAHVVNEVWFSGSHTDVGGGYEGTSIDGISLNWMIGQLKPYGLLPPGAAVYGNFADRTHDPSGNVLGYLYQKKHRSLSDYYTGQGASLSGRLKLHQSVLDRMRICGLKPHDSRWFRVSAARPGSVINRYWKCFRPIPGGRLEFRGCSDLIDVVDEGYNRFDIGQCYDQQTVPVS